MKLLLCLFLAHCSSFEAAVNRNVVVYTQQSKDSILGSGVVVQTGWVLTNYHLVADSVETTVNFQKSRIVAVDKDRDLALLVCNTVQVSPLKITSVKVGADVFYVGNPQEHIDSVSRGSVVYQDFAHIVTSTLAQPGMSGGGLWDYHGHLVGLNVGMEGERGLSGLTMSVHVPAYVLREFLKEHLK